MTGLRHEEYGSLINKYPFSLHANLERTPYNLSKEQNWHENIELQLCTGGEGIVILDGERYRVKEGDIVAVDSNVVHYTFTDSFFRYTCLIVSTDWCRMMNINYEGIHFEKVFSSAVISDLMNMLAKTYTGQSDELCVAKSNGLLLDIMIELIEKHSVEKTNSTHDNKSFDVIKNAVVYIQKNFADRLTLAEISEGLYLDKFTLCKQFKRYTGHTVIEYLHICRCMKAKEYLSEGKTVSEAAELCGFGNMSFFTKIFRRYTGKNPSFFRK